MIGTSAMDLDNGAGDRFQRLVLLLILLFILWPTAALALESSEIESQWGGYLRAIGTVSYPDGDSIYQFAGTTPFYDHQAELRLKNQLFMGSALSFETHYELVAQRGDTLEKNSALNRILPVATLDLVAGTGPINDDRQLMNLTHFLKEEDDHMVFHRLDRFNLTYAPSWGTLRIGRQALTWGNGRLFNPMDLFNPFAPTSVQKDYKAGADMLHLQLPVKSSEVQLLCVPRRNLNNGDVQSDLSSLAAKWHTAWVGLEWDLMATRHYNDDLFGIGATGYLGGAAWRVDTIYTLLNDDLSRDDFLQIVANIDYAWQWGGKNVYGLIEFFYNGLGKVEDYDQAMADPLLSQRLDRGEMFTLGKTYLAGQLQIELHPLVQTFWTTIINLNDPSGIFQPQLVWDAATDLQLIFGTSLYWGGTGSEYGGFETDLAGTKVKVGPAESIYLWLSYYF